MPRIERLRQNERGETEVRCAGCRKWKSTDFYYANSPRVVPYDSYCKTCRAIRLANEPQPKVRRLSTRLVHLLPPGGPLICTQCGEEKPGSDFGMRMTKGGEAYKSACRQCDLVYAKLRRPPRSEKGKQKQREAQRRYRARTRIDRQLWEERKQLGPVLTKHICEQYGAHGAAERIGCNVDSIYKWRGGKSVPQKEKFQAILDVAVRII